jgi:hypothetical protein
MSDENQNPFYEADNDVWQPAIREDAKLTRDEAIDCCIEGIRQMARPEELAAIIAEIQKT